MVFFEAVRTTLLRGQDCCTLRRLKRFGIALFPTKRVRFLDNPAVRPQGLAIDPGTIRADQESDRIGDVLWPA